MEMPVCARYELRDLLFYRDAVKVALTYGNYIKRKKSPQSFKKEASV